MCFGHLACTRLVLVAAGPSCPFRLKLLRRADGQVAVLDSHLEHAHCTVKNGYNASAGASEGALRAGGILEKVVGHLRPGGGMITKAVQSACAVEGVFVSERTAQRLFRHEISPPHSPPSWNDYRYGLWTMGAYLAGLR
jgi:hypothetical protein